MMLLPAATVLLAMLQAPSAPVQAIDVTPLMRDGRVLVTFHLSNAFTNDVLTAIHSGLEISFVYGVELKRSSTLWVDRTISATTITATVRYDNLTRKYHVTRKADGRIDTVEVLDREDQTRERLTSFEKLPLFSSAGLERNGEYYLRVRAHTTPRNATFVWPWQGTDVAGQTKFTVIR